MTAIKSDTGSFIDSYIQWIKSNSRETRINEYTEVTTPFLDSSNDYLQFYVKKTDNTYHFTDDGETLQNLALSGCDVKTGKRYDMLVALAASIGVSIQNDEITISGSDTHLPQMQHSMIQAMLKISDMFMLSSSRVKGMFLGDVQEYFDSLDIRYTPAIMLMGKSGLTHRYDFVIPATKKLPERLINTLNTPTKQGVQAMLFAWNDVAHSRNNCKPYMILNDSKANINASIQSAISNYDITAIPWSKRDQFADELAS